jgi:hypothetical protein
MFYSRQGRFRLKSEETKLWAVDVRINARPEKYVFWTSFWFLSEKVNLIKHKTEVFTVTLKICTATQNTALLLNHAYRADFKAMR